MVMISHDVATIIDNNIFRACGKSRYLFIKSQKYVTHAKKNHLILEIEIDNITLTIE